MQNEEFVDLAELMEMEFNPPIETSTPDNSIANLLDTGGMLYLDGIEQAEILLNRFAEHLQEIKQELDEVKTQVKTEKKDKDETKKKEVGTLLKIIDENSEQFTTQQYKDAMDSLMVLYNL